MANVLVLGTDSKLWMVHAPFGHVPPARQQVDSRVESFHTLGSVSTLRHRG